MNIDPIFSYVKLIYIWINTLLENVGLPSSSPETLHDIMNNIVPVMDSMVSSQDLLNTKLNEILRMYQIPEMPLEGKYSYTEYAEYTNTFVEYLGTHYYESKYFSWISLRY